MDYRYMLPDKSVVSRCDFVDNCTKGIMNQINVCHDKEMALEVIMQGTNYGNGEVNISIRMNEIKRCNYYYYDNIIKDNYISVNVIKTNCDIEKYLPNARNISFNLNQAILQIEQHYEKGSDT